MTASIRADKGFTLIETITALALGALIALAMMQVVVSGLRQVRTIRADALLAGDAAHLVTTLAYDIRAAEEVTVSDVHHATVRRTDGSTFDISYTGSSIEVNGELVLSSGVTASAVSLARVGETLHMTFTLTAGGMPARTFDGIATFTPHR